MGAVVGIAILIKKFQILVILNTWQNIAMPFHYLKRFGCCNCNCNFDYLIKENKGAGCKHFCCFSNEFLGPLKNTNGHSWSLEFLLVFEGKRNPRHREWEGDAIFCYNSKVAPYSGIVFGILFACCWTLSTYSWSFFACNWCFPAYNGKVLLQRTLSKTPTVSLWSQRAPKSTETQKELKWPKSDSKVTRADRPQSDLKVTQKWLRTPFLSHSWVTWGHSGVGPWESLLSHFWVTLILSGLL